MVYRAALNRRRLMAIRTWIAGLLIVGTKLTAAVADQSGAVEAIVTGGPGVLTKCRYWLVATSCYHYHHVRLPPRIAVGDTINLTYGSSTKEYAFPVARIGIEDGHCTIYSEARGNPDQRYSTASTSRPGYRQRSIVGVNIANTPRRSGILLRNRKFA